MDKITLIKIDDVFMKVQCDPGVRMELSEYFTFVVPGYKFTPAYKKGSWDGKIKLFNQMTGRLYVGLLNHVMEFAEKFGYDLDIDPSLVDFDKVPEDVAYGLASLFKTKYEPRYYQAEAVYHSLKYKRAILLSATSSGKSMMIYLITRYLNQIGKDVLIVVPTTSLVRQMNGDFTDYNNGIPLNTYLIEGGVSKDIDDLYKITLDDGSVVRLHGSESLKLLNNSYKLVKNIKEGDELDEGDFRKRFLNS